MQKTCQKSARRVPEECPICRSSIYLASWRLRLLADDLVEEGKERLKPEGTQIAREKNRETANSGRVLSSRHNCPNALL